MDSKNIFNWNSSSKKILPKAGENNDLPEPGAGTLDFVMVEKPLEDLPEYPGQLDRRRVVQRRPRLLGLVLERGRGEAGNHLPEKMFKFELIFGDRSNRE